MNRAHVLPTVLLLACAVSSASADVTDFFDIDLDQSQIGSLGGDDFWQVENLPATDELLLSGDQYSARIDFLNGELLNITNLRQIHFIARSESGLQYAVAYNFAVSGPNDFRAWGGATGSDMSGVIGGTFDLPAVVDSILVSDVDLDMQILTNAAAFTSLDVGLVADSIVIVPEPASLLPLAFGAAGFLRRRR